MTHRTRRARRLAAEALEDRTVPAAWGLDPTFGGGDGIATVATTDARYATNLRAVAVQPDGKVVATGRATSTAQFTVVRFTADGQLDPTFNNVGAVPVPFIGPVVPNSEASTAVRQSEGRAIAVQADGKILVAGNSFVQVGLSSGVYPTYDSAIGVARLNPDGSFDPTFGDSGRVRINFPYNDLQRTGDGNEDTRSLVVQPDGRIVVAALLSHRDAENGSTYYYDFALARLTPNGLLDTSFDGDGKVVVPVSATLLREPREPGFVLSSTGGQGVSTLQGLNLMPDGRIVLTGQSRIKLERTVTDQFGPVTENQWHNPVTVVRLTPAGALDPTLDGDGIRYYDRQVFTFTSTNYNGNGWVTDDAVTGSVVAPDGRVTVVGIVHVASRSDTRIELDRLNPDGSLDTTLNGSGRAVMTNYPVANYLFDYGYAVIPGPNGTIYVSGNDGNASQNVGGPAVVRLRADGTLDPAFDGDGVWHPGGGRPYAAALMPDGRLVLAGDTYRGANQTPQYQAFVLRAEERPAGTLQFAAAAAAAREADGTVTLTVTRTGGSFGAVGVRYATAPGTAGPTDFTAATGTLTWADGDAAAKTITITLARDTLDEPDETFTVALTPDGATDPVVLGSPATETVTITDSTLTTSTVVAPAGASVFTAPAALTATVTSAGGTPSGAVTFLDNGAAIGTGTLDAGGVATLTTAALAVGDHAITAAYAAAPGYAASTSAAVARRVTPADTTTALTAGFPNPSNPGQAVTLTAAVTAVTPATGPVAAGSVEYYDGGVSIGTAPVGADGTAVLTTASLAPGDHAVTARFTGTAAYNASAASPVVTQTVRAVAVPDTTTAVTTDGPSFYSRPVTLTATVTAPAGTVPQGSVGFFDGTTPLGTVPLRPVGNPQSVVLAVSSLAPGDHTITAQFTSTAGLTGSSGTVTQTVRKATTMLALTATPGTTTPGSPVTLAAHVVPDLSVPVGATGTVTFLADGAPLGGAAVGGTGDAVFTTAALPTRTSSITAVYAGDANFAGSTAAAVPVTVAVASSPAPRPAAPAAPLPRSLTIGGVGAGAGVLTPDAAGRYTPSPTAAVNPFPGFNGATRTATADVNADGVEDAVLVTGPGTPVRVAVVSGADRATVVVPPFDPFGGDFAGGGFVAAADLDGDGRAEIVVSPDQGGGPRVGIFSLVNGALATRANFFGIDDPNFRGGARAALGDVNGDGTPDLAVAAGFLGGPRTALFNGATLFATPTRLVGDFFAFPGTDATTLRNGVFVALGDVDGDGKADLFFGGGPGGAPRVFVLSGAAVAGGDAAGAQNNPVANFFVAGNAADRGGVRVAAKDGDGDGRADLVVGSGEGSAGDVRIYLGKDFRGSAEPGLFQDVPVTGGGVLAGGVYVG